MQSNTCLLDAILQQLPGWRCWSYATHPSWEKHFDLVCSHTDLMTVSFSQSLLASIPTANVDVVAAVYARQFQGECFTAHQQLPLVLEMSQIKDTLASLVGWEFQKVFPSWQTPANASAVVPEFVFTCPHGNAIPIVGHAMLDWDTQAYIGCLDVAVRAAFLCHQVCGGPSLPSFYEPMPKLIWMNPVEAEVWQKGLCVSEPPLPSLKGIAGSFGEKLETDDLSKLFPGVLCQVPAGREACEHPNAVGKNVKDTIIHLNDIHKWSREQIADWVESLGLDSLTLQAASSGD